MSSTCALDPYLKYIFKRWYRGLWTSRLPHQSTASRSFCCLRGSELYLFWFSRLLLLAALVFG